MLLFFIWLPDPEHGLKIRLIIPKNSRSRAFYKLILAKHLV